MKEIHSTSNPFIKNIVRLHDVKERKKSAVCLVEGWRACKEFLNSPYTLEYFFVIEDHLTEAKTLIEDDALVFVSRAVMRDISQSTTPSGVLGVFSVPDQKKNAFKNGVVLAQIQDPGNMGTLIRSAIAFKVPTIIVVEGTDPWSHKVIQSTAGTIAHADIRVMSWDSLLKERTTPLCALIVKDGNDPRSSSLSDYLLVVGNEARGLPTEWLHDCDKSVTLPMPGGTESLNAAVAGSIALYLGYVLSR